MKLVIVTGASQGLGLGICRDLLEQGYKVAACSRSESEALQTLQNKNKAIKWFELDVGKEPLVAPCIASIKTWAETSPLWALINNAGLAKEGVLATFPNVESDQLLQTNLHGALYMAREALRVMYQQNAPGRIINISSIIGSRGYTGLAAYSASKAGLDGLTRALARENGRRNITVNSIAPGYLETEMSSTLNENKRAQIINRTPLKRLGTISDITPSIRFLLSNDASFITGQTLTIDGGISN